MNSPIIRLANSTPAVRVSFLAAGLTVFGVAVMQSAVTVLAWLAAGL